MNKRVLLLILLLPFFACSDKEKERESGFLMLNISQSATMKSAADQRLTLPLSAAWAPELIAVRIAAVLMPPRADMTISRFREPYISRRTSVKKDIAGCGPFALVARQPLCAEELCRVL